MTPEKFNEVTKARFDHCGKLLMEKGEEYSRNGDRLWNFKVAAAMEGDTPEKALMGMLKKHWVSILDMVADPSTVTPKLIDDKLSDNITYSVLLEALFLERMKNMDCKSEIPIPSDNDYMRDKFNQDRRP